MVVVRGCADELASLKERTSRLMGYKCGGKSNDNLVFSGEAALFAFTAAGLAAPSALSAWKPRQPWKSKRCTDFYCLWDSFRFKTRTAWTKKSPSVFGEVYRNRRWLLPLCYAHMELAASPYEGTRQVYIYDLSDGALYVGLTCRPERRHKEHTSPPRPGQDPSPVWLKLQAGCTYERRVLAEGLTAREAHELEREIITEFRAVGREVLNGSDGGEMGGGSGSRYTYKTVRAAAVEHGCQSRHALSDTCSGAYQAALRNKWVDRLAADLGWPEHIGHVWTYELCLAEARKHKTLVSWIQSEGTNRSSTSYMSAYNQEWLGRIKREVKFEKPVRVSKWSRELCLAGAKKYACRGDWQCSRDLTYPAAKKGGWYKEIAVEVFGSGRLNSWSRGKRPFSRDRELVAA